MYIDDSLLQLVRTALLVAIKISFPVLMAGITIGLTISIFQSVTQVQEQSLSLVPKIIVMVAVASLLLPWIAMRLAEFAAGMFLLY